MYLGKGFELQKHWRSAVREKKTGRITIYWMDSLPGQYISS